MSTQDTIQRNALKWHQEQRALKAAAVELMQKGKCGTFDVVGNSKEDTTARSIAAAQTEINGHDKLIALFERDLAAS